MSDTHALHEAKAARKWKRWVFGGVAVVLLAAIGIGGSYWWQERQEPSQASAEDCALAQKIVNQTRDLPEGKDAVAQWRRDTQALRHEKMDDGYLGLQIAKYEGWAASVAEGEGSPPPSRAEQRTMADTANSHCGDAGHTIRFPPIGS
ncbi:hypothetical protein [Streptomyces sp. NPDC057718]|uniref:hypothetical protein n=1 Tax=Streptomyces sp. NPDC057718 TaxID=3346225 RepID=UPI0036C55E01